MPDAQPFGSLDRGQKITVVLSWYIIVSSAFGILMMIRFFFLTKATFVAWGSLILIPFLVTVIVGGSQIFLAVYMLKGRSWSRWWFIVLAGVLIAIQVFLMVLGKGLSWFALVSNGGLLYCLFRKDVRDYFEGENIICLQRGRSESAAPREEAAAEPAAGPMDTSHPLYGVHGWLKFIVIMNIYVGPVLFVLLQLVVWGITFSILSRYPGMVITSLVNTAASGYLVWRGIRVGRDLRDIRPHAVRNAKTLLKLCLIWLFVSIPFQFISGLGPDRLLPEIVKNVFFGLIGFAIWYTYFSESKRVRATYPDWQEE